jgi:hypothetical protein
MALERSLRTAATHTVQTGIAAGSRNCLVILGVSSPSCANPCKPRASAPRRCALFFWMRRRDEIIAKGAINTGE